MTKKIEYDNPRYSIRAKEGAVVLTLKHKGVNLPLDTSEAIVLSAQLDEAIDRMAAQSLGGNHG